MHYLIFVILLQLCYWFCLIAKFVLCATNKYELKGLTIGFGPVIFQRKFGKAIISLRAFLLFGWLTIISVKKKQRNPILPTAFSYLVCIIISVIIIGWPFSYDVYDAQLTTKVGYVADTVERWNPLVVEGEEVTGPAKKAGLLPGDEIHRVDGARVENFMDIQNRIISGKGQTAQGIRLVYLTVLRNGQEMELEIYPEVIGPEEMRIIGIGPKETFFIADLTPDMPAQKVGLEVGDQPVAIDGNIIHSFNQLVYHLEKTEDNQTVAFTVRKGGENGAEKTYDLIPVEKELAYGTTVITRKLIGFEPKFKIITTYPNPLTLIIRRVNDIKNTLMSSPSDRTLRNMTSPPSYLVSSFEYRPLETFGFFLLNYPFLHATMLCLSLQIFLRKNPA